MAPRTATDEHGHRVLATSANPDDNYAGFGTSRNILRDTFLTLDPEVWETIANAPSQPITQAGVLNGARYANVAAGTVANAETILLSRETFRLPCELAVILSMSQRISNNNVFFELVAVGKSGAVTTASTIPAPNVKDAKDCAGFWFDGTTDTSVKALIRDGGVSESTTAMAAQATTAATGTGPNFLAAAIFTLEADYESIYFSSELVNTQASKLSGAARRTDVLLDPNVLYKVRIRVLNGAVAPASNTDVRIHAVRCQSLSHHVTEFRTAGRAGDLSQALQIFNSAPSALQATVVGPSAHGVAISGPPLRTGKRAVSANPTAVATGQTADDIATLVGAGIVKPYAIPEAAWNGSLSLTTATAVAMAAAAGAGLKRHITALQAINTGTAVDLIILDGVTERWRITLPQNVPVALQFPTELLTTANAALNFNLSAVGTVRVNAQGYTAP